MKKSLIVLALVSNFAHAAVLKTETHSMSWNACIQSVQKMTQTVNSRVIVSTDIIAVVRFETREGSILATCSKPDAKLTVTYTNNPF